MRVKFTGNGLMLFKAFGLMLFEVFKLVAMCAAILVCIGFILLAAACIIYPVYMFGGVPGLIFLVLACSGFFFLARQ
jgi:hypothetical protein